MKKAIKYMIRSVWTIYDKLFPHGAVRSENGTVRRKGLREFLVGYFLVMFVASYVFSPLSQLMLQGMMLAFFAVSIHALILYCKDTPATGVGTGITAETLAAWRRAKEAKSSDTQNEWEDTSYSPYDSGEYDSGNYEEYNDEYEESANTAKPQKATPPKQKGKYSSPLEEAVISEALYGIPFDPKKH